MENVWNPADEPPEGENMKWTREVIAVTNYGCVYRLAYIHCSDGWAWEKPHNFGKGERVEWWTDNPADIENQQSNA